MLQSEFGLRDIKSHLQSKMCFLIVECLSFTLQNNMPFVQI